MAKKIPGATATMDQPRPRDTVDLLEELEGSYGEMMQMFMSTSRRILDNAVLVQAMLDAAGPRREGEIRRVEAVKDRLHRSILAAREDFVRQTQQIIDSPAFSSGLKERVRQLRSSTSSLASRVGGPPAP